MSGPISQFIQRHYRHFNAATLVDAAEAYNTQLAKGGQMMITLAGAMSTAELGLSLAEIASVLELKGAGERSCGHTTALIEAHVASIDEQIAHLSAARRELAALAERARGLDPSACTDPNRCQVIEAGRLEA